MQAWEGQQQTLKGIVWLRYRCMNAAIIVMYSLCSAFPFPIEDPPKTFSRQFQLTQSPALGNFDIRLLSFKARKTFSYFYSTLLLSTPSHPCINPLKIRLITWFYREFRRYFRKEEEFFSYKR